MYKTLIQIVLFLTLIFVLSFTFYKYFYIKEKKNDLVNDSSKIIKQNDKNLKKDKEKEREKEKEKEDKADSIIYNLSYKKFDIQGNIYWCKLNIFPYALSWISWNAEEIC